MQCKVGDTVRFLNDVGGGVVSRIINAQMVSVRDDDGFEIPVLISDIVVVAEAGKKETVSSIPSRETTTAAPDKTKGAKTSVQSKPVAAQPVQDTDGNKFEVLLAFVPVSEKDITNSDMELYLINDSSYHILYTVGVWTERNKVKLLSKNDLEPDSKEFINGFARADLNRVQTLHVTFLLYKQTRDYEPQVPEQINIEINPLKFVKAGSFEENDFFDERAVIYKVATDTPVVNEITINPQQLAASMKQKNNTDSSQTTTGNKKNQEVEEIDLHIENLVDDATGLDNAQIIEIQKSRFITALDLGITAGTRRMVFIHGVGNGKLKYEIRRLLDTQYAGKVRYQDASFKEYGYGATMVII